VVIDFLEGNPDRPLCIGCVYHGGHDTPYPLPDEKTKSTIKSSSSPGGEGFNELRFDDAKDHEEIYIHGQKDLRIEILHDVDTRIDHNETRHVGGDRQITVVGNQIVEVKGQPPEADSGKAGSFRGSCTSVSGDYKVAATSTAFISAPTSITLSCPGSSIVLEPGKITISAGGGASIVLDANALMKSAGGSHILLDGNAFVRGNGGGSVLFDANANMTSSAGSQVLLDGNAAISGSGGGNALFDANAKVVGGTATVASSGGGNVFLTADAALSGATTTCAGAGGSVKLDGGGAAMSGAKVDIGGGVVNIG
jgi:type VI secretion system secreted protein VgrG